MPSIICKIYRFFLNLFDMTIKAIASAIKTIGEATVDILSSTAEALGEALGISGSSVLWIAALIGGFILVTSSEDEK